MHSRLIVFAGTVGAGKSTQMKLLASKLSKENIRVKTVFLKTNHLLAHALALIIASVLIGNRSDTYLIRYFIEEMPVLFRKLFRPWLLLDVLSVHLRFILTIYLPAKIGYTILVEEYLPATISDYIFLAKRVGVPPKSLSFASNHVSRLMNLISPTQIIFLDSSMNKLKLRWSRRSNLDERPDYIHMQRTTLLSLSRKILSHELFYIDTTTKTIRQTHELIVNHLIGDLEQVKHIPTVLDRRDG